MSKPITTLLTFVAQSDGGLAHHLQLALEGGDCLGVGTKGRGVHTERDLPDCSDRLSNVAQESDGCVSYFMRFGGDA